MTLVAKYMPTATLASLSIPAPGYDSIRFPIFHTKITSYLSTQLYPYFYGLLVIIYISFLFLLNLTCKNPSGPANHPLYEWCFFEMKTELNVLHFVTNVALLVKVCVWFSSHDRQRGRREASSWKISGNRNVGQVKINSTVKTSHVKKYTQIHNKHVKQFSSSVHKKLTCVTQPQTRWWKMNHFSILLLHT